MSEAGRARKCGPPDADDVSVDRGRHNEQVRMTSSENDNDTGSWFPVPAEADLPDGLRGLFGKARERLGFFPNVFRVYSFRPERLSAWFAHFRQLHEPTDH